MSIVQFFRILLARRWMILAIMLSCVTVALAVGSQLPRRYPASARIMLDVIKPDPVTGQMIAGTILRTYTRTQLELIQDYRVVGEVVDKLGFTSNPQIIAQWQAETGGVGDMRRWAAERIISGTEAQMLGSSNILEITYTSPNPTISKNVAAMLREAYIDATLRFRTDAASRSAEWFREQAEKERRALVAAEAKKSEFEKANNIVVTPGGVDPENAKLDALQQALLAARSSVSQAQFSSQMAVNNSGTVDSLTSALAQVNDQITQAADLYGTAHPSYKALITRRATLQSEISRATAKARAVGG
ncbi:MAG TPA: exopolysaccharide biosynthesis protein EpsF, partial [Polymorphobacter sp.]|nr:exopolysaccharide biosynthesis protein EpsF [Polymorphobacter sp.]